MEKKEEKTTKTLVIYFSYRGDTLNVGMVDKGNNEFLAEYIGNYMKADLYSIEDSTQYPEKFKAMKEFVNNLRYAKKRPRAKNGFPNVEPYDTIFLIYPIWNDDIPMVIHSFIEKTDFTNKTIIPLCTHEVSGICKTYQYIKDYLIEAKVIVTDFCMIGAEARKPEAKQTIENWLKSLGY